MHNDRDALDSSNSSTNHAVGGGAENLTHSLTQQLRQFAGYETLGVIGIGGIGVVYRARQIALQRLVAIKTLRNYQEADPKDIERFRFEAEIVAQFQHPNIVQLYHIGEEDGQPFLAFEYVEGGSLAKRTHGVPQTPRQAAVLIETLARAVHAAHLRAVVHRDLTPNNILIAADGTPKIADFGLARMQERSGIAAENVAGTASYMAPEQAWGDVQGKTLGPVTDVYGLGAILYELLCGQPPFKASTSQKTLMMVFHDLPRRPRSIVPNLPGDLEEICLRCLKKDPTERFASAEALARDLRRFLNGEPIDSRPVSHGERLWLWVRRNPLVAGLSLALACIVVLSFAVVTERMIAAQQAEIREHQRAEELDASLYRNQFLLARNAWESSDVERALTILKSCNRQRRSFEWYYLSQLCQPMRAMLPWQGKTIAQIDFSPGKKTLAIAAVSGTVLLIDASTGAALHEFAGHEFRRVPVAFSPDGLHLASVGSTGNEYWIRVWETESGSELKKIGPLQGSGEAIRFLLNGEICSLAVDQSPFTGGVGLPLVMEVWSLTTGKRVRQVKGPDTDQMVRSAMLNASISADGKYFAWTPGQILPPGTKHRQEIQICETESGRVLKTLIQPVHLFAVKFSFSPDSRHLVSIGDEGGAILWDVLSGQQEFVLKQNIGVVHAATFSPDGNTLAMGGADSCITLHNVVNGQETKRLRGHAGTVNALAFSADSSALASSDTNGGLSTWPLNYLATPTLIEDAAICSLAFVTNNNELSFTTMDARLRGRKPDDHGYSRIILADSLSLAVSSDQSRMAVISPQGKLRIGMASEMLRLEEVSGIPALANHGGTPVTFNSKGDELACISKDGSEVLLIDVMAMRLRMKLVSTGGRLTSVAYHFDGKLLAAGTEASSVLLWQVPSGKPEGTINSGYPVRDLVFRPYGDELAVLGTSNHFVQLWTVKTRELRRRIENQKLPVNCLTFTPDGRRLVTGGADRKVRISDADSGLELLVLPDAPHEIQRVACSANGLQLAASAGTALNSGQILIWSSDTDSGRALK